MLNNGVGTQMDSVNSPLKMNMYFIIYLFIYGWTNSSTSRPQKQ